MIAVDLKPSELRFDRGMSENAEIRAKGSGAEVYVGAYDAELAELWVLPEDVHDDLDRSTTLGIGVDHSQIIWIRHGPLVAPEAEVRLANLGSLTRAIAALDPDLTLYVDLSASPIDEDMLDTDDRYHLELQDSRLVAIVTQRRSSKPVESADDFVRSLSAISAAYGCGVDGVRIELAGGGVAEDFVLSLGSEPVSEKVERFVADQLATLNSSAHDIHITLSADPLKEVSELLDGATAVADFMKSTRDGPLGAEGILNLLRGGHHHALVGTTESSFLEAKAQMHPIWLGGTPGERAKIELAQDVARFANGDIDAVMVIGFKETVSAGRHQIGQVSPVANEYLDIARINEVLDARLTPPIDGLVIETFALNDRESVLAVFVPRQPGEMQPYLVHGAIAGEKVEGAFFSIVRRRGEGSITTSAEQIHAYVVAGRRYLRGES
ncbi:hypothetical protein [Demequina aurantiaca]|uniref:hypothetical protein n=1 Tax=Demequina aurantiaca TaxID=676200 RepID=UPI003D340679